MRPSKLAGALVGVTVAVTLLAGCGSSKSPSATSPSSASVPASTTTSAPPTTASAPTIAAGGNDCAEFAQYVKSASSLGTAPTPAQVQSSLEQGLTLGEQALKDAPSSVAPAAKVVLDATRLYYAALGKVGYKVSALPPSAVNSTIGTPQVLAADKTVDAYIKNTCGIATP